MSSSFERLADLDFMSTCKELWCYGVVPVDETFCIAAEEGLNVYSSSLWGRRPLYT